MEGPIKNEENKPEENLETQLSPEVLEMVMEKVIDVNTHGLAIKRLGFEKINEAVSIEKNGDELISILKTGVVGSDTYPQRFTSESEDDIRSRYKKKLSDRKITPIKSPVYFNIMGRSKGGKFQEPMQNLYETRWTSKSLESLGLIFDCNHFKEVAPTGSNEVGQTDSVPLGSFCADDFQLVFRLMEDYKSGGHKITTTKARKMLEPRGKFLNSEEARNAGYATEDGLSQPNNEYGFFLNGRVAPRWFIGLFINLTRKETDDEIKKRTRASFRYMSGIHNETDEETDKKIEETKEGNSVIYTKPLMVQETDESKLLERAKEIAGIQMLINNDNPERLMPIYDIDGNLLWPKEMTHEEVIRFVEERDKLKEDEER